MAGGKETPRQKMIGMMYLVLTAMLALNVSSSVLQSFLIVNDSVLATNANFEKKVESMHAQFDKAYLMNKEKMQENYDKSLRAKELTAEFRKYVRDMRNQMVAEAEGISIEEAENLNPHNIGRQDNYDTPTNFFIERGKGTELKEKMIEYKKNMLDLIDPERRDRLKLGMDTDGPFYDANGNEVSWENQNFFHTIIVGACTILNKIENDAMNIEYDVVAELYAAVSDDDFKFDNIEPRVLPASTYVLLGETFEADVFVAAYDSKSKITATVGGQTIDGQNGVVRIRRTTTTEGPQTISGVIHVPGVNGTQDYPFSQTYTVARPSATVSADAMNVFYVGVDNPISISASGVDAADLSPQITNGTISKVSNGKYIVRIPNTNSSTVKVTVNAKVGNTTRPMTVAEYRVKRVPDPLALVNGIDEYTTNVDKNVLANSGGLRAFLKDFDFKLDTRVVSFSMLTNRGGDLSEFKSGSNQFTEEMKNVMRQARKGQRFFFEDIKVQMPTGVITVRSINLTIK